MFNVECSMLNGKAAAAWRRRLWSLHSTFNIEHSTFNIQHSLCFYRTARLRAVEATVTSPRCCPRSHMAR